MDVKFLKIDLSYNERYLFQIVKLKAEWFVKSEQKPSQTQPGYKGSDRYIMKYFM